MDLWLYFRAIAALIFVIAMIGLASFAFRRLMLGRLALPMGSRKRLAVVDMAAVDAKRRLVLVRRDDVEHLVLLGVNSETVIETNIPLLPATQEEKA